MKLVKANTDTDTDMLLSVNMSEGTRSCPIIRGVVRLYSKAPPQLIGKMYMYVHPGLLYLTVICNHHFYTHIGLAHQVSQGQLGAEFIGIIIQLAAFTYILEPLTV